MSLKEHTLMKSILFPQTRFTSLTSSNACICERSEASHYDAKRCGAACNLTHWQVLNLGFAPETFQSPKSPLSIGLQHTLQPAKQPISQHFYLRKTKGQKNLKIGSPFIFSYYGAGKNCGDDPWTVSTQTIQHNGHSFYRR